MPMESPENLSVKPRAWPCARNLGAVLVALGVLACSGVNRTPLADAAKMPRQEYLYGPTGDVAAVDDDNEDDEFEELAFDAEESEESSEPEEDEADDFEVSASSDTQRDDDKTTKASPASVAGTYKGTDWVVITLPGFPDDEQVDDQARVVLTVLNKNDRYSFAVLDTRTGDELCKIVGALSESIITFDDDQTCFAGILGVAMEASVLTGIATVDDDSLTVTLGVELSVNTPNGELTGELDYRFEGKK